MLSRAFRCNSKEGIQMVDLWESFREKNAYCVWCIGSFVVQEFQQGEQQLWSKAQLFCGWMKPKSPKNCQWASVPAQFSPLLLKRKGKKVEWQKFSVGRFELKKKFPKKKYFLWVLFFLSNIFGSTPGLRKCNKSAVLWWFLFFYVHGCWRKCSFSLLYTENDTLFWKNVFFVYVWLICLYLFKLGIQSTSKLLVRKIVL